MKYKVFIECPPLFNFFQHNGSIDNLHILCWYIEILFMFQKTSSISKVFILVYQDNFKFKHFDRNCCVNKNSNIYDFSVFVQFKLVLWEMSFKSVLIFSLMFLPLPQAWEGCLADWVVKLIFSSFKYSNICLI